MHIKSSNLQPKRDVVVRYYINRAVHSVMFDWKFLIRTQIDEFDEISGFNWLYKHVYNNNNDIIK